MQSLVWSLQWLSYSKKNTVPETYIRLFQFCFVISKEFAGFEAVDWNLTFGMNVCSPTRSQFEVAKTHVLASRCRRLKMSGATPPLLNTPSRPVA
jgi:hypothetical protein